MICCHNHDFEFIIELYALYSFIKHFTHPTEMQSVLSQDLDSD